jgi:hypothetical protein
MGEAAGAGSEDGYTGERNGHAGGFAPCGLLQTKEYGEDQCVDWAHAHDDGRVRDVGVMQASGEANLVDDETEKTEIGEGPVIAPGEAGTGDASLFLKDGQAAADRDEQDHEDGGDDNAQGTKGESRDVAESDFANEEVDGPDQHQRSDGNGDDGGAGGETAVVVYTHGDGRSTGNFSVRSGKGSEVLGNNYRRRVRRGSRKRRKRYPSTACRKIRGTPVGVACPNRQRKQKRGEELRRWIVKAHPSQPAPKNGAP